MSSVWRSPGTFPMLVHDEVHIWQATLNTPSLHIRSLEQILSEDERSRAARFRSPQDAARFIVSRGTLRSILGYYLLQDPSKLQFHYGHYGKPALAREASNTLYFNITHTHDRALYAVTYNREVGIDLEDINDLEYEQIARSHFSHNEVKTLEAITSHQMRIEAFFRIWTRKEAFLKARGLGLSLDLQTFDIPLAPVMPISLLGTKAESSTMSHWSLYDLPTTTESASALAVEGPPCPLTYWQWRV